MKVDSLLYMVARTHDWNKNVFDNVARTFELIKMCEQLVELSEDFDKALAEGNITRDMSPDDIRQILLRDVRV